MIIAAIGVMTVGLCALAYFRVRSLYWHLGIGALCLVLMVFFSYGWFLLGLLWLFVAIPHVRYRYFIRPLLAFFKKNLPDMSQTEREALAAGDVWWDRELFSGTPAWSQLRNFALPQLTEEENYFLKYQVETLCGMLDDWHITTSDDKDLPKAVWHYLKQERFFGMIIPKVYGGLEFSARAHAAIITKIGTRSPTAAITVMVPNSLGPAELLLAYGTQQQRDYYLPRLARGEEIPCFALTGTHAGSDAAAMRDYGVVCRGELAGESVLGIRLYCDKRYITLAPIATLIGIAFKLYDPDHLLGEREALGITLCLVPANHPGIETGPRHYPMHLPFMNGPVRAHGAFIPLDFIIGGVQQVGMGWKMLMNCLSVGRSISLPAISAASAQLSYRMTGAYAVIRQQFNLPIAKFDGVKASLARIAGLTYLLNAMQRVTTAVVDSGIKPSLLSAIAKYHATEFFRQIIHDAMDIHGGKAIQLGPRNYLASAYTGIPIGITVEGANILTRNLIIFGQGLMRCHPFLLQEMELSRQDTPDIAQFDRLITAHIAHVAHHAVRTGLAGLSGGATIRLDFTSSVIDSYRQLSRMSSALALVTDIAITILGGQLKRKERLSARLGDVLSYLYMASCVLKEFHDRQEPASERDYVEWSCHYCLYNIQEAFIDFLQNFPNIFVGKLLQYWIFPLGRRYQKPTDKLEQCLVQQMIEPSDMRNSLTAHCYLGVVDRDITARVEAVFQQQLSIEPIERKFVTALKQGIIKPYQSMVQQLEQAVTLSVLSAAEAQQYREFVQLRDDVLAVDEFSAL